ncbi:MAG: hypothetical protein WD354_00405 [Acidimicrobiia bacterium]
MVGLLIGAVIALGLLVQMGHVTGFLHVPAEERSYYESLVGPVVVAPSPGHDGKTFFLLANDPWLTEIEAYGDLLGIPRYRAQRILYPMIAGVGGLLSPSWILWTLLGVNVMGFGLGSWATAGIAQAMGRSPWLGLAFAVNPGMYFELAIDGSSIIGWALALCAIDQIFKANRLGSVVLLTAATLARETMWLVALGCAAFLLKRTRWWAVQIAIAPLTLAGLWAIWVMTRIPDDRFASSLITVPFEGLVSAAPIWIERGWTYIAVGLLILVSATAVIVGLAKEPNPLTWGTAGFVALLLVLHRDVLIDYGNATRVIAPLITTALIVAVPPRAHP